MGFCVPLQRLDVVKIGFIVDKNEIDVRSDENYR